MQKLREIRQIYVALLCHLGESRACKQHSAMHSNQNSSSFCDLRSFSRLFSLLSFTFFTTTTCADPISTDIYK